MAPKIHGYHELYWVEMVRREEFFITISVNVMGDIRFLVTRQPGGGHHLFYSDSIGPRSRVEGLEDYEMIKHVIAREFGLSDEEVEAVLAEVKAKEAELIEYVSVPTITIELDKLGLLRRPTRPVRDGRE